MDNKEVGLILDYFFQQLIGIGIPVTVDLVDQAYLSKFEIKSFEIIDGYYPYFMLNDTNGSFVRINPEKIRFIRFDAIGDSPKNLKEFVDSFEAVMKHSDPMVHFMVNEVSVRSTNEGRPFYLTVKIFNS